MNKMEKLIVYKFTISTIISYYFAYLTRKKYHFLFLLIQLRSNAPMQHQLVVIIIAAHQHARQQYTGLRP